MTRFWGVAWPPAADGDCGARRHGSGSELGFVLCRPNLGKDAAYKEGMVLRSPFDVQDEYIPDDVQPELLRACIFD